MLSLYRRRGIGSVLPGLACLGVLGATHSGAGEISGLPPHLAPTVRPDYGFYFGNDFAAVDTSDDYRTGQMIVSARIRESWLAVLDHSIMTREDLPVDQRGRIDTMTLSLGYEFRRAESNTHRSTAVAGIAVRSVGNYEGERIQNGFHRLVRSDIDAIPYTDTRRTDPAAWFLGERYQRLKQATGSGFIESWDYGAWARAGLFAGTDGVFDAVAGLYGVASRRQVDVWLGLRRDWRSGYDHDFVLRDTAAEEDKFAVSLGARFGSLVIETVHRIDSSASYGQLTFVSSPETRAGPIHAPARFEAQAALHIPHMTVQLAARWYRRLLTRAHSSWDEALIAEVRGGEPQLGRNASLFVDTLQASLGFEWSRRLTDNSDWLRFYTSAAAGWRAEQLLGREELLGEKSDSVDRAVLLGEAGFEFDAIRLSRSVRMRLRFGITAWLPTSDKLVTVGGTSAKIQRPGASIAVAWVATNH